MVFTRIFLFAIGNDCRYTIRGQELASVHVPLSVPVWLPSLAHSIPRDLTFARDWTNIQLTNMVSHMSLPTKHRSPCKNLSEHHLLGKEVGMNKDEVWKRIMSHMVCSPEM